MLMLRFLLQPGFRFWPFLTVFDEIFGEKKVALNVASIQLVATLPALVH